MKWNQTQSNKLELNRELVIKELQTIKACRTTVKGFRKKKDVVIRKENQNEKRLLAGITGGHKVIKETFRRFSRNE